MQNLPSAEVYEKEFEFMPWGILTQQLVMFLVGSIPQGAHMLDLMCGPGYLLGKLHEKRPDIRCIGVDIDSQFIDHAEALYPHIQFRCADVCSWRPSAKFDVIICTAGVHHLPDNLQETFVSQISEMLLKDGFAIIADPYIGDYDSEQDRLLAGAKLGYEYLVSTIQKGATPDVIDAAVQILRNDVLLVEWKTSVKKRLTMLKRHFMSVEVRKTWPSEETDYGDYYIVVRK